MNELPKQFTCRLQQIIPKNSYESVLQSFSQKKTISFRINTLKSDRKKIIDILKKEQIHCTESRICKEALILSEDQLEAIEKTGLGEKGILYRQGLSSQMVSVILSPQRQETILDLCAAPGSKSSDIAAKMENTGMLVCVENIKKRFYKLKSVLSLLGVTNAKVICIDGRRYRPQPGILFDRILVDAPCSSEGRFHLKNKKTYAYWSVRKIKEMQKKQKGLLHNAVRMLKPAGTLVYSTCTFAPEENEAVVNWILKKYPQQLKLVPITINEIPRYPSILTWNKRSYNEDIRHCLRILPGETTEAFFVAQFVKT